MREYYCCKDNIPLMIMSGRTYVLMMMVLWISVCEEWYQPDSRMISDVQFQSLVLNDRSAFKIVKYFSPHCQFCRYLKQVVDMLKHEKEWCFRIYDFNCAWYPQHCMQNVRSASFPYTAIHNAEGALHQEIHGFYPEPIIRTIFDRIEQQCKASQRPPSSLSQEASPIPAVPLPSEPGQVDPVREENKQHHQNPPAQQQEPAEAGKQKVIPAEAVQQEHPSPSNQNNLDQPKIPLQEEQIKIATAERPQDTIDAPAQHVQDSTSPYVKYGIYGITALIAVFYFHHINKGKSVEHHASAHSHPQKEEASPLLDQKTVPSNAVTPSAQVEQILQAQSELIAAIPDEQL